MARYHDADEAAGSSPLDLDQAEQFVEYRLGNMWNALATNSIPRSIRMFESGVDVLHSG